MHRRTTSSTLLRLVALGVVALLATAACGDDGSSGSDEGTTGSPPPVTVRLGYFPNLTHASAIVGVEKGLFAATLGADAVRPTLFNAGPDAVTALLSGAVDAAYLGPNPAINAFVQSRGQAVRIVSGATSSGALLVVKPEITTAADLKGEKVATPQLGGTQDVALRHWLKQQGLRTDPHGGGDVSVTPQGNAQSLESFKAGAIAGAWVPEPWATRLVLEAGGKVLVDEHTLWPGGRFVTTHLVVATTFLKDHPDAVRRLVEAQVAANRFITERPDEAKQVVNDGIAEYTGKALAPAVIDRAWANLEFTNDPIASSLVASANHAKELGLLRSAELDGIYDLTVLNDVLRTAGQGLVAAA